MLRLVQGSVKRKTLERAMEYRAWMGKRPPISDDHERRPNRVFSTSRMLSVIISGSVHLISSHTTIVFQFSSGVPFREETHPLQLVGRSRFHLPTLKQSQKGAADSWRR